MFLRITKHWAKAAAVALLLAAAGTTARAGDDDLFSDGSLFGAATRKTEEPRPLDIENYDRPAAPEPLSLASLDDRLREAGLSPRIDDGNRLVDIQVAGVDVPVQVDVTGERVTLVVQLANVPSGSAPNPTQLRQLLQANQVVSPAFFVFNANDNRLEMRRVMRNVGVTPDVLRAEFKHLTAAAGASTALWTVANNPTPPPNSARPTAPDQPTQPPVQGNPPSTDTTPPQGKGLIGRWIVELKQGGGFVIRFDENGKFLLGHVKADGKIDRSNGSFRITNGQLVLESDDGSTLQGKFAALDTNRFSFAVGNGEGLTFTRR